MMLTSTILLIDEIVDYIYNWDSIPVLWAQLNIYRVNKS